MKARILALGNEAAGDDGAAIDAARQLESKCDVTIAGRPGSRLLDLLSSSRPTVLIDVVRSGQPPGTILRLPLSKIADASAHEAQMSSHGFGPSEVLRLGKALGRPLPIGQFVGIEGADFGIGQPMSPGIAAAMDEFVDEIWSAVCDLES